MTNRVKSGTVAGILAVAIPLLFGAAACGGSSPAATAGSPADMASSPADMASSPAKTGAPAAAQQNGTVDNSAVGNGDLPAGFPLPPGTQIMSSKQAEGIIRVAFLVTSGAGAYKFWWQQLPTAGYHIIEKQPVTNPEATLIQFTGNGWKLSTIAINGNSGSIILTKRWR
jgi:hypothetical protein